MKFLSLPFGEVEVFDYYRIAQWINDDNPDIIWISLGAPKQEQFMNRLKPFLKKGVMFGIGAAFKFHSGINKYKRAPRWIIRLRMEWFFRILQEPRRMIKRYGHVAISWPRLIWKERNKNDRHKFL
jgi:N-acetylglucosaminyldiphosphoundecaprenol N-acetyl-beta-D-mannosaminyltransferase